VNVLIRTDSSSTIGTGHVMRDLVLAKQFLQDEVMFATMDLHGDLNAKIADSGYAVHTLSDNSIEELDGLIKRLSIDMLVIDHYGIDYEFEKGIKKSNPNIKIFVVDDTYEKHYCDELLNHNINADKKRYLELVPKHCELRCGAEYTLLREEFYTQKQLPKVISAKKNIFVAMGGADHSNINIEILEVLNHFDDIHVNVVTTSANSNLQKLIEYCNEKAWASLFVNSNQIAKLMHQSDFAIVTPSVTVNEIIFMGTPFIAIKTANNQDDMYKYLLNKSHLVLSKIDVRQLKDNVLNIMGRRL